MFKYISYRVLNYTVLDMSTVDPRLTDTPEMQSSIMIMRTLRSVRNAISIDLHTIRTPEIRTPHYSVKRILGKLLISVLVASTCLA